jgi:hypothetical protein
MRRVVTKRDSEHRVAQDGFPRDVHLMIEPATTGAEHLAMGAEAVDPGSQIPVHVHPDAEEFRDDNAWKHAARARADEKAGA